jgi:ankyrin repeat protein
MQAIDRNSSKDVRELLESGKVDVNSSLEKDSTGTALFRASFKGFSDVVEILLQFKADV